MFLIIFNFKKEQLRLSVIALKRKDDYKPAIFNLKHKKFHSGIIKESQ